MMLRKPNCSDCPHNLQYMESLPIKKKGVTMHLGERFCVAGKRARKFKRSDPRTYVPSWCPMLKTPCELRIYEGVLQRELDGLDDEFSVLKLLSQELQVRARSIRSQRFQQRAA